MRFRRPPGADGPRTSNLEIFYDLAFVFAVTQVSHLLLDDLSWRGAGRAMLVLLVVWWAWNYTTWVTNELDPESTVVRLVLIAVMLASLLMAVAIPGAFGDRALLFAGSYVAIQVGRHAFLTWGAAARGTLERERAGRILAWFAVAGVLWIAGALVDDPARVVIWLCALAVDYSAPLVLYRIPGRPKLTHDSWDVETAHFAERFQLFMIIALGETIVITGATTAARDIDAATITALSLAFLATAAMWWLYFSYVATIAQRRLELAPDRTRVARDGYTYLHVLLVAGIILAAVGDELVIAHPTEHLSAAQAAAVVGGPALYLFAHVLFRLRMARSISRKRLTAAAACLAAGLLAGVLPAIAVAALLVAILVGLIVAELRSERRRRQRGEPSPLERVESSAEATTLAT